MMLKGERIMNSQNRLISIVYIIMGILTILLCLVVADGQFGLNPPPAGRSYGDYCVLGHSKYGIFDCKYHFLCH